MCLHAGDLSYICIYFYIFPKLGAWAKYMSIGRSGGPYYLVRNRWRCQCYLLSCPSRHQCNHHPVEHPHCHTSTPSWIHMYIKYHSVHAFIQVKILPVMAHLSLKLASSYGQTSSTISYLIKIPKRDLLQVKNEQWTFQVGCTKGTLIHMYKKFLYCCIKCADGEGLDSFCVHVIFSRLNRLRRCLCSSHEDIWW